MNPGYRLARSSRRDLQEISDFWYADADESVALQILGDIIESIVTIARHPGAGVRAEKFGPAVRKFPSGVFRVYYRPYPRGIEILHVFHGARHQLKAWRTSAKKDK